MADIMSVWSWSLSDFDRVESFEDLAYWHGEALKAFELKIKLQLQLMRPPL